MTRGTSKTQHSSRTRPSGSCMLAALSEPHLACGLPGLRRDANGEFEPIPEEFPCCSGTGLKEERNLNIVSRCELATRIERLRVFGALERAVFASSEVSSSDSEDVVSEGSVADEVSGQCSIMPERFSREIMTALARARVRHSRGLCFVEDGGARPTSLWSIGRVAIWRFGFDVHVLLPGRSGIFDGEFGLARLRRARGDGPRLVLIEVGDLVSRPARLNDLDVAISVADGMALPVFLATPHAMIAARPAEDRIGASSSAAQRRPSSVSSQFARRLVQARESQTLVEILGPATASKLRAVCELSVAGRAMQKNARNSPEVRA